MNKKTAFWRIALVTVFTLIAALILIRNTGPKVNFVHRLSMIPHFDKLGHFFLMGLLSLCAVVAFTSTASKSPLKHSSLIMLGVFIISTLEEISQIAFPSRTFSMLDLAASATGIFFFGMIGHLISRRISSPE